MCNFLYAKPCTDNTCSYYHPEVNRFVPADFCFLTIVPGRSRPSGLPKFPLLSMQKSELSAVPLQAPCCPYSVPCFPSISQCSFCRMKKWFQLDKNRLPIPSNRGPATQLYRHGGVNRRPKASLRLPPHHPPTGRTPNVSRGTMDIVPRAGTVRCSTFTG